MANLTKEQRKALEAEKQAQMEKEIEARIRAEYEEKLKNATVNINNEDVIKPVVKTTKTTRIPLDTMITVVCNTIGGATYISKKASGYIVEWEDFGSEEYMELGELVAMRNTDRRFFEDNWIVLEDTDEYDAMQIYEFLKVAKYYTNVFTSRNIDELFSYSKDKIAKTISTLSRGMKETIAVRAKQKLDDNTLDKNIVDTLESALGIQFTI
jgi:hypothetical protein